MELRMIGFPCIFSPIVLDPNRSGRSTIIIRTKMVGSEYADCVQSKIRAEEACSRNLEGLSRAVQLHRGLIGTMGEFRTSFPAPKSSIF